MTLWLRASAGLLVVLGAVACGGDSDGSPDAGGAGGTGGGTGGTSGGTGGTGGTDGGTSTGGTGATAMCDTSITDVSTCGSNTCPPTSLLAACQVRCCVGTDTCGYRDTTMGMTTDCVAAPPADTDCPDYTVFGTTYPGCCKDDSETCGYVSPSMNACADPGGMPSSANCDGTTDDDAGTP